MTRRRLHLPVITLIALAGLIAPVLVLAVPAPASACSCVPTTLAEQIDAADTILDGRVEWTTSDDVTTRVYGVAVAGVYRGRAASFERIETPALAASCGRLGVVNGERYLFFLHGTHPGQLTTDRCDGTTVHADSVAAALVDRWGPAAPPLSIGSADPLLPEGPREDAWQWSHWLSRAGGVAVAAVALLVLVRIVRGVAAGERRRGRRPGRGADDQPGEPG